MQPTQAHTLNVPGANLYYEVRGSGPVLLLICGGPRREPPGRAAGAMCRAVSGTCVEGPPRPSPARPNP
jgi:hypothetical protein